MLAKRNSKTLPIYDSLLL